MHKTRFPLAFLILLAPASVGLGEDVPDYSRDIAPILQKYCIGCHPAVEPEGGLVLESYTGLMRGGDSGAVVQPRESQASLLIARVTGAAEPVMPPEDEPRPTRREMAILARWIEDGAVGPGVDATAPKLDVPRIAPSQAARPITALAFSPDGKSLAVARFGLVELLDVETREAIRSWSELPGKVTGLCFSADGTRLVTASGIVGVHGRADLWRTETGELLQTFAEHDDALYAVALSQDGSRLATASYDRTIVIWDVFRGEPLRTLEGHNGAVFDLAFARQGRILASASADATIKVWNAETGQRLDTLGQPLKEQYSVDISPDGKFLIAGGEDNRIRMWRLLSVDRPQINPLRFARFAHEAAIQQVRFSPDGKHIVSASSDGVLKVWSAGRLRQLHAYPQQADSTQALAISKNRRIAVGRMDGSLDVYPLRVESDSGERASPRILPPQRPLDSPPAVVTTLEEHEPNDEPSVAQEVRLPCSIQGALASSTGTDEDLYRFSAHAGETWILEIKASQTGSPLDSHLSILDDAGRPVPRLQLRAIRDSYFTFRGKDSTQANDFRLHNWEEMKLNQFLYASGEVVKLFHYPRGPDSGFNVYPNFGNRHGYFDTTPIAHALHEPCYIVEPHPVGAELPPNGLPVFMINFENDDDSLRRLGRDSRLTFVAPHDGEYVVRVRDVRGFQGEHYTYALAIRSPRPDFTLKVIEKDLKVSPGTGRKFGVQVERIDGFDGPIDVEVRGLLPGFSVAGPLHIEAGHLQAWGTLMASEDAQTPDDQTPDDPARALGELVATATIGGNRVERRSGSLGKIERGEPSQLLVRLVPDHPPTRGTADLPVIEIRPGQTTTATIHIQRKGYEGRVNFGKEDAAVNAPHGVYVAHSGLNGVLIVEGQDRRQFFIAAEPWVPPMERLIFVEAEEGGKPTSAPVILRVLAPQAALNQQASGR